MCAYIECSGVKLMKNVYMQLSEGIVKKLSIRAKLSPENEEILCYFFRTKISEVVDLIVLLALFWKLGWLNEFLISFVTMILVRPHTGGIHQRTYLGCFVHTVLFFIAIMLISGTMDDEVYYGIFAFCYITDIFIVPMPSKERGRFGRRAKQREKVISLIMVTIFFLICSFATSCANIIQITLMVIHIEIIVRYLIEGRLERCSI